LRGIRDLNKTLFGKDSRDFIIDCAEVGRINVRGREDPIFFSLKNTNNLLVSKGGGEMK
jgi:hypothetical protein